MSIAAHIFAAVVTLPCLWLIVRLVRSGGLRVKYAAFWVAIGTLMLALIVVPALLNHVSSWVGIAYPPALLFLVSTMLLMFLSVHFSWELSRLEERTRTLAEEIALMQSKLDEMSTPRSEDRTTELIP